MGINIAPDVFQEKMQALFDDMSYTFKVYLDDLIIITNGSFADHLIELRKVFHRLRENQLQLHADKSSFCILETEYLGFVLTRPNGIKPQPKKVQAILNIASPTNVHQLRSFLGAINHYKQLIPHCLHLSTPSEKGFIRKCTVI